MIFIQVIAISQYLVFATAIVTLPFVITSKENYKIKTALASIYSAVILLAMNDSVGVSIADKYGLLGSEPLIFGTWQLPIEWLLGVLIVVMQLAVVAKRRKDGSSKRIAQP
jgi:hypothetical protein